MNFRVNSILSNTNTFNRVFSAKNIKTAAKTMGLALTATTMLTVTSCSKKSEEKIDDSVYVEPPRKSLDEYCKTSSKRVYHFGNKGNRTVTINDYDWAETIYPDGSSVRDSAGLKIYISKDGERTVEATNTDRFNNKITTKTLPNGNKLVRKDFYLKDPNEILYTEKIYNKDSILISKKYYNKAYLGKDKNNFTIEESNEIYNDKGILLKWTNTNIDIAKSDTASRYDDLGRIIYDFEKNEYYSYKRNSTKPSKSFQIYKGCTHITEYNNDSILKSYYVASDGTITE